MGCCCLWIKQAQILPAASAEVPKSQHQAPKSETMKSESEHANNLPDHQGHSQLFTHQEMEKRFKESQDFNIKIQAMSSPSFSKKNSVDRSTACKANESNPMEAIVEGVQEPSQHSILGSGRNKSEQAESRFEESGELYIRKVESKVLNSNISKFAPSDAMMNSEVIFRYQQDSNEYKGSLFQPKAEQSGSDLLNSSGLMGSRIQGESEEIDNRILQNNLLCLESL